VSRVVRQLLGREAFCHGTGRFSLLSPPHPLPLSALMLAVSSSPGEDRDQRGEQAPDPAGPGLPAAAGCSASHPGAQAEENQLHPAGRSLAQLPCRWLLPLTPICCHIPLLSIRSWIWSGRPSTWCTRAPRRSLTCPRGSLRTQLATISSSTNTHTRETTWSLSVSVLAPGRLVRAHAGPCSPWTIACVGSKRGWRWCGRRP